MNRSITPLLLAVLAAVLPGAGGLRAEVTDKEVSQAIEDGRKYLIKQMNADGSFGGDRSMLGGKSALAFMTLAYMGEHPNREYMSKALDYVMALDAETGFNNRQGYAVPIRVMGLSYVYKKLLGEKRELVHLKMKEDVMRFEAGQAATGGWRYELKHNNDWDFSVTQWPILAMREANLCGIEFKDETLKNARALYLKEQKGDGGWTYQHDGKSYGSMTAAGVASLFIIADVLEPASGCPCKGGQSQTKAGPSEAAIEKGLAWLGRNFSAKENPGKGDRRLYWLYCVERVGITGGHKYFGEHNWYKEGADAVVKAQKDGHWGSLDDTCFALLFLYKGRAPVLFNKLKFDGQWNMHRRDIANLTTYIERTKEQQFHWQIVELRKAPLEELHDAPILYITAESPPNMTDADKKKLRQFTDTGGTILFEASCGNPAVRKWFQDFAKDVWPEWPCKALGPDHGSFTEPYDLKQRPEILGVSDGLRTCVFYAMDDVSCAWQLRSVTAKAYLFNWGINLYAYATDGAPLRAKLAGREPERTDRFNQPVKAGPKKTLRIARIQHGGDWEANANYGGLRKLAAAVKSRSGLTLEVKENTAPRVDRNGTAAADLADNDVAYVTGSSELTFKPAEKEALKAFVGKGGLLWIEAAGGAGAFDQSVRRFAADMGWELKLLPPTHPLMNGKMEGGAGGYNLTSGIEFRPSMRRRDRLYAEFFGLYQGDRMVGVYSPLDLAFSATGYQAYRCRGYKPEDACAVATNLAIYFSTLR